MPSELIFDLHEFQQRLRKYGDGTVERSVPLLQSLDIDKWEDPNYTISLGDIMITCGVELTLIALSLTGDRRQQMLVMLPIIISEVTSVEASQLEEVLKQLERWATDDETADLHKALRLIKEIHEGLPERKITLQPRIEEDLLEDVFPPAPPLTRSETGLVLWALEYALGILDEDEDAESYYRSPRYLADYTKRLDLHRMMAHIITLSPPHALIGKGHAEGYQP